MRIQVAKVLSVLYVVMSLPVLPVMALAGAFKGSLGVVLLAIVTAPLIYGLLVFLFTGPIAWLYNQVAHRAGGFEYSIEEVSDTAHQGVN